MIGNGLKIEAIFMLFPLFVSFFYGSGDHWAFICSSVILAVIGTLLGALKPKYSSFRMRDAYAVAGLAWLLFSFSGTLPYWLSGCFSSFIDCVFESVSGFTTTGASVLTNVEILPKGILFWRSLSQWVGGMGVLLFMMAVMPSLNSSSINILRAETTGPAPDRVVPRIRETARIMYLIYLGMTFVLAVILCFAGLPVFDSIVNAFATAGTGGASTMNASIAAYNNITVEVVITIFMFLFGISFTLYFLLLDRKFSRFVKDSELRLYFGMVVLAIVIVTLNVSGVYGGIFEALRYASFQVSSIVSTTGFSTTDFSLWPTLSQIVLVVLMVVGGCAASTSGGMKQIRVIILIKAAKNEVNKIFHPESVKAVSVNGRNITSDAVSKISLFFFIYFAFFIVAVALISIEGKDILSSVTAVISAISNIGPGLGTVGPASDYAAFSPFSKGVLSFCMIAGRLEFFPILILLTPSAWLNGR